MNQMILIMRRHGDLVLAGGTLPKYKREVMRRFSRFSQEEWFDLLKEWNSVQREMLVLYRREKYGRERRSKSNRSDWIYPAWKMWRKS